MSSNSLYPRELLDTMIEDECLEHVGDDTMCRTEEREVVPVDD